MKVCMEEKKKWLGQSNYSQAAFLSQGNLAVWHESNSTKPLIIAGIKEFFKEFFSKNTTVL